MGRKATLPSSRSVAETPRCRDSCPARHQAAPPGARVDGVQKTRHCDRTSRGRALSHPPRLARPFPQVIDDFSHPIPVLERELDAIEMYLGPLIDKMLQRKA
jgi:hypothetical protein